MIRKGCVVVKAHIMNDNQTYFVGVGAMRSGTTWLHSYLEDRDDVFVPRIKELHYFNVKFKPDLSQNRQRRLYSDTADALGAVAAGQVAPDSAMLWERFDRLAMERDPAAYKAFFERRVMETHRVFGEITPAYSLLDAQQMQAIKDQFPKAKAIFLLRDPVSRFVSHLSYTNSANLFDDCLQRPGFALRGAYDVIYSNLEHVFGRNGFHTAFYETLFTDDSIASLCSFLGLPFEPGNYDRRTNASRLDFKPSVEQIHKARRQFAPIYDFCQEKFGDDLPAGWLT